MKPDVRKNWIDLAKQCNVPIVWIGTYADENSIQKRVSQPRPDSEANFEVYEKIRDAFEPFQYPHLKLQSDQQSIEQMVERMQQYIQQHDACTT
jgi:predicted kinase